MRNIFSISDVEKFVFFFFHIYFYMALTSLLVLVNCVTLFTVNEPRVGLPLPAATDVLLKRHCLVRTNFDVGGMLDLSALESSLN